MVIDKLSRHEVMNLALLVYVKVMKLISRGRIDGAQGDELNRTDHAIDP